MQRFRSLALILMGAAPVLISAACSEKPAGKSSYDAGGNTGNGGQTSAGGELSGGRSASQGASGESTGGRVASAGGAAGTTDAQGEAGGQGEAGAAEEAGEAGAAGQAGTGSPCTDPLALPLLSEAPATLAGTQLYPSRDADPGDFAPHARPFQPRFELWSDGATKQRFVYLPACQIDTSDMDYWKYPVGTRLWKEFRSEGKLLETRFIHRYGAGESDWLFATYQWDLTNLTPEAALRVDDGAQSVNGTQHDIPSRADCRTCHVNLPEPPIGFSAIQLSHALPGESLRTLSETGRLTHPAVRDYLPPGDESARAALGYLHANCGHCHNSYYRTLGNSLPGDPAPRLRLSVKDRTVEQTTTYTTLVGVGTFNPTYQGYNRIEPCNPTSSSVVLRMATRAGEQMPPLASKIVHGAGLDLVSGFIRNLPAPGAPACPR